MCFIVFFFVGMSFIFPSPSFDPSTNIAPPNAIAQVVAVGSLLAQSLGLSVLSWLFLTRNEYYKMSSLAHTGMLPTNSFRMD